MEGIEQPSIYDDLKIHARLHISIYTKNPIFANDSRYGYLGSIALKQMEMM